ncbi:MAG TPA: hypothetical protein VF128_09805 [Gemmatimonadaceae bacterium]
MNAKAQRIAQAALVLVSIGWLSARGLPESPWRVAPADGTYQPPKINGWNDNHACDQSIGICFVFENSTCKQTTQDNNPANGRIDPGEMVKCKDTISSSW